MTKKAPKPLTPERVARLVKNPGTRSKVPTRLLPQQYRKARALNERLNAPVVPGSSLTNRDVAKQTKQYVTMKYGAGDAAEKQGLASQQTLNTDTGGWYDEYIKSLQQHSANVGTINDQAAKNVAGFGQGLSTATGQTLAGQSDPISQGVNAQAAAVRDARAGSWVGQVASQGQAQKTYADTLANVVGPGQKLQARAQGARKLSKLEEDARTRKDTKAADAANYRAGLVADESKNQTALAIARGKANTSVTVAKTNAAAKRDAANGTVNKYGYTTGEWKQLTPAQRREAVRAYTRDTTKPGSGGGTKLAPDKVHTMDQWNAATVEQRRKWLKASGGKDGKTPADPAVKAQKRFSYAYAKLGQDAAKGGTKLTPEFIRRNSTTLINNLVADTKISRKMARRVLSAYIKNQGGDPGSFKTYGKPGAPAVPVK